MLYSKLEKAITEAINEKDADEVSVLFSIKSRSLSLINTVTEPIVDIDDSIIMKAASYEVDELNRIIKSMGDSGNEVYFQALRKLEVINSFLRF